MVIKEISQSDKGFPRLLADIYECPKKLHVAGNLPDLPLVAIVGSRKPSNYGEQVTYRLSYDLARAGIGIVSGLAYGIDAIAHRAALDAGGITVGVLGCGLGNVYPARHKQLAESIIKNGGAIISEYEKTAPPLKHHFPARNRIIAGLSLLTLVTEADASSGSLITANFALQQNRLVAAVPGSILSPRSAGPNNLIKNGAIAATDAVDILSALELELPQEDKKPRNIGSAEERQVINQLAAGISSLDELIETCGMSPETLASTLSLMEITGKVKSLGGGNWLLTK